MTVRKCAYGYDKTDWNYACIQFQTTDLSIASKDVQGVLHINKLEEWRCANCTLWGAKQNELEVIENE